MSTEEIIEQAKLDAFLVRAKFNYGWCNLDSSARRMVEHAIFEIEALTEDRDEYQIEADKMAAAHKVERDELTAKVAAFEYRVDELTHSRDELKPDAERYRWMSAQIVSGDFDLLEKAFGTVDPQAETVTQAEFDGVIDEALKATLNQPPLTPYAWLTRSWPNS